MRIAVYHNLPSGGAKRTLTEACKRLALRHHVEAYSLSSSEQDFADLRPWVAGHHEFEFRQRPPLKSPLGRLNPLLRQADLTAVRLVARGIAGEIDARHYDVALIHPCQIEQSPSVLRYLRSTPSVYYCQESLRLLYEPMPVRPYSKPRPRQVVLDCLDPLPVLYRRRQSRGDQANTRSARRVLVNSYFSAGEVQRIYRIEPRVSYHGVDVEQFRPLGLERQPFVLSVGSLTPLKGFDFLIQAMARYPSTKRPPLVIASNFQNLPERAYLERLAADLGVCLVLRTGVTDANLLRLYNEAAVVVYAPIREPFGLVPLEAMACATPVVAVAEGGIPESIVDRETGILVEREPARFAAAVKDVIEDSALARRLGGNGRAHVLTSWTWDAGVRALERELMSVA